MESQDDARGIRVTRTKGTEERAAKHYAGWHSCGGARLGERKREKEGDAERANGGSSHTGRMTGLLRRGEESGGYDRRRVQIITIIIFPGNMAAERGWPPGVRVEGKREDERGRKGDGEREERERERESKQGERGRQR